MKELKFKLKKDCEFDDTVRNLRILQSDIENILDYTLDNGQDPADYVNTLFNYFKDRPNVVSGLMDEMNVEENERPNLKAFTNKIALLHLHARQAWSQMNSSGSPTDIDKTIKVPAPRPTGYIVYNTAQKQEKALKKIRNSEEMKDIFPDIARA